jgi:uncharacterized membrane protein YhaH (DUF805 family)
MQKKKFLLFVLVFSLIAILFKLWIFYSGQQLTGFGALSHILVLALLLPACFLFVKLLRDEQGAIGGQYAFKQCMKFVLISAVVLSVFNFFFYEFILKDYIIEFFREKGPALIKESAEKAHKKVTDKEIQDQIAMQIQYSTAYRDTTGKLFSFVLFGAFSAFISAMFLKRKT